MGLFICNIVLKLKRLDAIHSKKILLLHSILGQKHRPRRIPLCKGDCVNAWTVKIYVPKLYVGAYQKLWDRDWDVQGSFMALEDNMPEDK